MNDNRALKKKKYFTFLNKNNIIIFYLHCATNIIKKTLGLIDFVKGSSKTFQ